MLPFAWQEPWLELPPIRVRVRVSPYEADAKSGLGLGLEIHCDQRSDKIRRSRLRSKQNWSQG